jgi:hypothetical protein
MSKARSAPTRKEGQRTLAAGGCYEHDTQPVVAPSLNHDEGGRGYFEVTDTRRLVCARRKKGGKTAREEAEPRRRRGTRRRGRPLEQETAATRR